MFKTFFALLLSAIAIVSVSIGTGALIPASGIREMYFLSPSSNCKILRVNEDDLGKFIYFKPALKGESVTLDSEEDGKRLIANYSAKTVFFESVDGIKNEYYYSEKIPFFAFIDGKKVNLHVSYSEGKTTVGIPLIFGSY